MIRSSKPRSEFLPTADTIAPMFNSSNSASASAGSSDSGIWTSKKAFCPFSPRSARLSSIHTRASSLAWDPTARSSTMSNSNSSTCSLRAGICSSAAVRRSLVASRSPSAFVALSLRAATSLSSFTSFLVWVSIVFWSSAASRPCFAAASSSRRVIVFPCSWNLDISAFESRSAPSASSNSFRILPRWDSRFCPFCRICSSRAA
mmetsp:Transcript_41720/g.99026  ORF Transcript_41720/g.99026 Transcript_41720/m.99026 type:complete len:204 (-) Transcript_41720:61-672(-)